LNPPKNLDLNYIYLRNPNSNLMKTRIIILVAFSLLLSSIHSCKKDEANVNNKTVTDKDGNVYETITIGTQIWMAENLKTTKYNDGTAIPQVTDNTSWDNLTTPGYCWYNNEITNIAYGALYNWNTVNTGKLCPTGWHVPTDAEWTNLTTYLGDVSVAAIKLKEIGSAHWISPNTGSTNETGFTALPAGYRSNYGTFASIGYYSVWWTSTENSATNAWVRLVSYNYDNVGRNNYRKVLGHSVRCLKN
jgi:uncharacterized protein (TIGR02145 family)